MDIKTASSKWGISERSIRKAISENRVRHVVGDDGELTIPDDEIRPLKKAAIQSLLWVVLGSKNDPSWTPEISEVPDLQVDQLCSAFCQLSYRKYLDGLSDWSDIEKCFEECRVTALGMNLVKQKPLPGSGLGKAIFSESMAGVWARLLSLLPSLFGMNP